MKKSVAGGDTEQIKADTEALQKAFYPIAEKVYQAQAQAQGEGAGAEGAEGETGPDGEYYGAGFEDRS